MKVKKSARVPLVILLLALVSFVFLFVSDNLLSGNFTMPFVQPQGSGPQTLQTLVSLAAAMVILLFAIYLVYRWFVPDLDHYTH